jgi:SnoaL-like domain
MDHTVENLLLRNLLDIFGESDAAKRHSAIAALWAADGVFADPHGRYVGYAAINDAVSQLHKRFPGFVFTPIGSPQSFFDVGRQAWGHGPAGEPPKVTGLDVVISRHGRIVALYAFIDTPGA